MRGRIRPPGSKSITNRALLCAALARGDSVIEGALVADDAAAMTRGLLTLGVEVEVDQVDPSLVRVRGRDGRLGRPLGTVDVGASGTTARFLTAAAALAEPDSIVHVDGTPRMRERPIRELTDALERMGVRARCEGARGCPPVAVTAGVLRGGEVLVDGRRSSQFVSGILLVAPYADRDVDVRFEGGEVVSRPYLTTTLEVMRAFGAEADDRGDHMHVKAKRYEGRRYEVEADASAAVYPALAAVLVGGEVEISNVPANSTQADLRILEVAAALGGHVERRANSVIVRGQGGALRRVDVDLEAAPDGALAVAVVCAFADGPCILHGLHTLRLKETDRLEALRVELNKLGARARIDGNALFIEPGTLRPASISTYDDHRMAMSFALAGLRQPGVEIEDPGCVSKTWPRYFEDMAKLRPA
jgi:3-phosphoshikimate 1-carboxyvinyltransferase